jgi:RNA polymerase sigma factor (sigma-70 family)
VIAPDADPDRPAINRVRRRSAKGYVCHTLELSSRLLVMTSPTPSDDQLGAWMRAAQLGDATAYLELLRTVTPRIRRIVGRQRGFAGAEDVEDLVQDVLLSLHVVRTTYDPARPFMPWLLAIVRNRLADGARRYARTAAREVHVDDVTLSEPATNPDPDTSAHVEALQHAVRALPAVQRQAIELLKLQELSLKEAAAASGTSVGALKVATHRAIAALRKALMGEARRS